MNDKNHEAENRESGNDVDSEKYIHVNKLPDLDKDSEEHSPKSEGGKMPEEETENLRKRSDYDKNQGKETEGIP